LVENGTHVLFGTVFGPYRTGEVTLARQVVGLLKKGMLCLADRSFYGFGLWQEARAGGSDLLWRVKIGMELPRIKELPDGSYLSLVYPPRRSRDWEAHGATVRVVEYELEGVDGAEPFYRLLTTLLDPEDASAEELAALYHERWEIETVFDELKTHLRGAQVVLRSKTPELVRQEVYGLLMAHFAVRNLMHEAALQADADPDRLSFAHSVRVVRRKVMSASFSPSEADAVSATGSD